MRKPTTKHIIRNPTVVSAGDVSDPATSGGFNEAITVTEDLKRQTLRSLKKDFSEMKSNTVMLSELNYFIEVHFSAALNFDVNGMRKKVIDYMISDEKNYIRRRKNLMNFLNAVDAVYTHGREYSGADHDTLFEEFPNENTLDHPLNSDKELSGFSLPGSCEFSFSVFEDGYFFRLPELTNYYNEARSYRSAMTGRFIQKTMTELLLSYEKQHGPLKKFDSFLAVFSIHFVPGSQKDTDNYDIKKPLDAVNGILIENDNVERSHILVTSFPDEKAYTELYILLGHDLEKDFLRSIFSR